MFHKKVWLTDFVKTETNIKLIRTVKIHVNESDVFCLFEECHQMKFLPSLWICMKWME